MLRPVVWLALFACLACSNRSSAQSCPPVTASEALRLGSPANLGVFRVGQTWGPVLGRTWDPFLDPSALLPTATVVVAAITPAPANIPAPFGTILCDFTLPAMFELTTPGMPFGIVIPNDCNLAGVPLTVQGAVLDTSTVRLANAFDIVIGTRDTLYREFVHEIQERIQAAGAPAMSKPIYTTQDFLNRVFVRNPNCWAADIDLTGLSPWNQGDANRRAGTLISPRHIAFAAHYPLSTTPGNNEIVFVTQQNVTVTRQVVASVVAAADIQIGLLDADVPSTIAYYKVLPRDWRTHLPASNRLPMLHLDQEEKALVRDMNGLGATSNYSFHSTPLDPVRLSFSETLIGGDSGNPAFLVLDDEAILILTHHYANGGPFYTYYWNEVNAAMAQLGGGYQLTEFDLASR